MEAPERLTLKTLAANFMRDFVQADDGLWGTMVQMTFRPRKVVESFLFEDRKKFVRASRYLFFCLSIAAFQLVMIQARYGTTVINYLSSELITPPANEDLASLPEEGKALVIDTTETMIKKLYRYSSYASVLFLPFFALLTYFLFPLRQFNYAESLLATTYIFSHSLLINAILPIPFLFLSEIKYFIIALLIINEVGRIYWIGAILVVFWAGKRDLFLLLPKLLLSGLFVVPWGFIAFKTLSPISLPLLRDSAITLPAGKAVLGIIILLMASFQTVRIFLHARNGGIKWYQWLVEIVLLLAVALFVNYL